MKKREEKSEGRKTRNSYWGYQLFFLILGAVLSLGQLERVAITQKIAFYGHDILIVGWLIFCLFSQTLIKNLKKLIQKWQQYLTLHPRVGRVLAKLGLVLLGTIILGWILAGDQGNFSVATLLYTARYGAYLMFGMTILILQPLEKKDWIKTLLVYALITILLSVAQYIFWPDTRELLLLGYDDHYGRLIGPLLDPNIMGLIFVLLFLTLINWKSQEYVFFRLVLGLVLLALLFCTYSRSAYLALLMGLIATVFIRIQGEGKVKKKESRLPLLAFLPLTSSDDSLNLLRTNSMKVRLVQAEQALQTLSLENWIFGRGLFVAPDYEINWLTDPTAMTKITANFGDNFFLIQLSFFGLIGGVIMLGFYAWLTIWLYRQPHWRKVLPLWLAWLTSAQFINAFYQPTVMILTMLLVAGMMKGERREAVSN